MKRLVKILCGLLLCLTWQTPSLSQTSFPIYGQLIYTRQHDAEPFVEFVTLYGNERVVYVPPQHHCWTVSHNGQYIVYSTENADTLTVHSLIAHEIIFETTWLSDWQSCQFGFGYKDNFIYVTHGDSYALVDFLNDEITVSSTLPSSPPYPHLPDVATENWVLASPDNRLFLYPRCADGEVTIRAQDVICSTDIEWVIYDNVRNITIAVLGNVDTETLLTYPSREFGGASWSPQGQYLAHLTLFGGNQYGFPLHIMDIQVVETLNIAPFASIAIDNHFGLHWSPDGNRIALWVRGRVGEPQPGDESNNNLRHLVIFELGKNRFIVADQPYSMLPQPVPGLWSPDGLAFAFQDADNRLIYVDAITGNSSVIDDGLLGIIAWH